MFTTGHPRARRGVLGDSIYCSVSRKLCGFGERRNGWRAHVEVEVLGVGGKKKGERERRREGERGGEKGKGRREGSLERERRCT